MKQFKDYLEVVHENPKFKLQETMGKWAVIIMPNTLFDKMSREVITTLKKNGAQNIQIEISEESEEVIPNVTSYHWKIITFKSHYKSIQPIQFAMTPLSGKYKCSIHLEDVYDRWHKEQRTDITKLYTFQKAN